MRILLVLAISLLCSEADCRTDYDCISPCECSDSGLCVYPTPDQD
jgi:hypothetical protein